MPFPKRESKAVGNLVAGICRENNMTTAAEYRAWAEESLKWAGEAKTANERSTMPITQAEVS